MQKAPRLFTLIELLVSLAILGLASSVVVVHIREMVATHTFQSNVSHLISELKKSQLLAACNQIDVEVVVAKDGEHLSFWVETDDQLPCFSKKKMLMTGVRSMESQGKGTDREVVHFYPSGRFDEKTIILVHTEKKKHMIDMQHPLMIEHKGLSR